MLNLQVLLIDALLVDFLCAGRRRFKLLERGLRLGSCLSATGVVVLIDALLTVLVRVIRVSD